MKKATAPAPQGAELGDEKHQIQLAWGEIEFNILKIVGLQSRLGNERYNFLVHSTLGNMLTELDLLKRAYFEKGEYVGIKDGNIVILGGNNAY